VKRALERWKINTNLKEINYFEYLQLRLEIPLKVDLTEIGYQEGDRIYMAQNKISRMIFEIPLKVQIS
jgi:hypothetical protein